MIAAVILNLEKSQLVIAGVVEVAGFRLFVFDAREELVWKLIHQEARRLPALSPRMKESQLKSLRIPPVGFSRAPRA
jgi:hypothetical protein